MSLMCIQILLIAFSLCHFVAPQQENFATGLANAILGAFFPDLNNSPQQKTGNLLNPQNQQRFNPRQPISSPTSNSPGQRQAVINPATLLNTGASNAWPPRTAQAGNLPPVDFFRGFSPNFAGLTNPDYQNSFLYPSGLQGRTDLPADYVYPFAQPGSLITPGSKAGELFSLGGNSLPVNLAPQSQPSGPTPLEYLFTGQPSGLQLNPSISTALASLLNISSGPPANPSPSSQWFTSGVNGQNLKKQIDSNSSPNESSALANKKFRSPSEQRRPDTAQSQASLAGFLNPSQQDAFSGSQQLLQPFAASPQLLQASPQLLQADPQLLQSSPQLLQASPQQLQASSQLQQIPSQLLQAAPGQPLLVQPQIFNQIFPQGAQLGQIGSANAQQQPTLTNTGSASRKQQVSADADPDVYGIECPQCSSVDVAKMSGPWVQVYGNPDAMRTIYTTISTLQGLYGDGTLESGTQSVQPVCVGFQFSRPHTLFDKSLKNGLESTLNLYYRDDTSNRQLHEVLGRFRQDPSNPKRVSIKLPGFSVPMCAVKVGPPSSTMYSYAILTETIGTNRCQSYHVLARDSDTFFRDYNRNIAEFLKSEVESGKAKPLSVLPYPDLCQLQSAPQILRKA